MIIAFDRESHYSQQYFVCVKSRIPKVAFLHRARVKRGTYAGEMLANLYDAIFIRSLELKHDYCTYYQREYSMFAEYLRKRLLVPMELVERIDTQFSRSTMIFDFHPGYFFLHGDYGLEFLKKLIEPRIRT